jgi:TRAP-type C4-dicarboxylate transport system substrate-binding protein
MFRSRTRRARLLGALLGSALILTACGGGNDTSQDASGADDGKTYNLRFAHYFGPTNAQSKSIIRWADEIKEKTDGRVDIEFFYQEALVKGTEMLDGVGSGRTDLGYIASFYFPAELPLSGVAGVPFVTSDPGAQAKAFYDLYQENELLREEYESKGIKVLTFNPITSAVLGAKEEVKDLDWFKGKRVRSVGQIASAVEAVGGNPVALSFAEIYEGMQRGVVDAYTSAPFEALVDIKVHEVGPYIHDTGLGQYLVALTGMNMDTWESLPQDIQEVITEASENHVEGAMEDLVEVEDASCTTVLDGGGFVGALPDAEIAKWKDIYGVGAMAAYSDELSKTLSEEEVDAFIGEYEDKLEQYEAESDYVTGVRRCAERS